MSSTITKTPEYFVRTHNHRSSRQPLTISLIRFFDFFVHRVFAVFYCGESYGSSCYRLRSKTGEFIYLKTHGYLELSANTESFASFICVNTLVANEEGENEIRQMQKRFSAVVESKTEPGILAIAENQLSHVSTSN